MKKVLNHGIEYFVALLFAGMVGITFLQVIFRYVLNNSLSWSEEASRYMFIWMSLFGAALAIKYGSHMAMESLVQLFPARIQKAVVLINSLLVSVFIILVVISGYQLIEMSTNQTSTALSIPMQLIYLCFPISGLFMIYFLVMATIKKVRELSKLKNKPIKETVQNESFTN